jgi:hypothetical protein
MKTMRCHAKCTSDGPRIVDPRDDAATDDEEHARFLWLVQKMDVDGVPNWDFPPPPKRGQRQPVVRTLRQGLAFLDQGPHTMAGHTHGDCWAAGREANWRFGRYANRHYLLQHDKARDGDNVRVTIIDDVLFRGREQCRRACCAILSRKREWTLGRDMRIFVARTVWATRWHQKWSEVQQDERRAAQRKKLRVSE